MVTQNTPKSIISVGKIRAQPVDEFCNVTLITTTESPAQIGGSKIRDRSISFESRSGRRNKKQKLSDDSSEPTVDVCKPFETSQPIENIQTTAELGSNTDGRESHAFSTEFLDNVDPARMLLALTHAEPEQTSLPSKPWLVKTDDHRWMCNICEVVFDHYSNGCFHEINCNRRDKAKPREIGDDNRVCSDGSNDDETHSLQSEEQQEGDDGSYPSRSDTTDRDEDPNVGTKSVPSEIRTMSSIAPLAHESRRLSEYNHLLTRNVELFQVSSQRTRQGLFGEDGANEEDGASFPSTKVGFRCIHCAIGAFQATASTFFPSSKSSIASGIGTIGARHFVAGKCPAVSDEITNQMRMTKRKSQVQTRRHGMIGLDIYCKGLAKRRGIENHPSGGIYIPESDDGTVICDEIVPRVSLPTQIVSRNESSDVLGSEQVAQGNSRFATLLAVAHCEKTAMNAARNVDTLLPKPDRIDQSSFLPSSVQHFWECRHCRLVPVAWRASGSVVFSPNPPTLEMAKVHLEKCNGGRPLCVPQDASIDANCDEQNQPITSGWDKHEIKKKSGTTQWRHSDTNVETRQQAPADKARKVNAGVDDRQLVFPDDKDLTTEYAFYTMQQLKKCFLTKSGGSRGACPIGFPGLACSYCSGQPAERRFFYTSSDHLRNSFSHIPAHLSACTACPDDVKRTLETLKAIRIKQKSRLKVGSHKEFIDRVWERLHSDEDGRAEEEIINKESFDRSSDDESTGRDNVPNSGAVKLSLSSSSGEFFDAEAMAHTEEATDQMNEIDFGSSSSVLVDVRDRCLTTDYIYLSFTQVEPYNLTEKDVMNGRPSFPIGFPGLICIHCKERKFCHRSSDHLRNSFSHIPNHLFSCKRCPAKIKAAIASLKALRLSQEATLKRGMHMTFVDRLWGRLIMFDKSEKPASSSVYVHSKSGQLILSEDKQYVTDFTFYIMQQMMPCELDASYNGARGTFGKGYPGLACIHCACNSGGRKFFYRSAEILAGNYTHLPNHLMACRCCPLEVKANIEEKKKFHAIQKTKLGRGSQRVFFTRVWNRLHAVRPKKGDPENHSCEHNKEKTVLEKDLEASFDSTDILSSADVKAVQVPGQQKE